jgi:membrane protease YdiL (CAAX protease family)
MLLGGDMPSALMSIAAPMAIVILLGLAIGLVQRDSFRPVWLLAAAGMILFHDFALTRFWGQFPTPGFLAGTDWNWTGKVLAILATLLIASLPQVGWRRSGITLRQEAGWRAAWIAGAVISVIVLGLAAYFPGERGDAETLAFQWTMPGLEEEIFYRGVLLLAFNEALRARARILGAQMGWGALLTALLFGLEHALSWRDGAYAFEAMSFMGPAIGGLLLVWFRERSGSVVLPIFLHNLGNAALLML